MIVIAKCPTCGSDKIKKVRRTWNGKFQEQSYSVARLKFHECPTCGEKVYDREAMGKSRHIRQPLPKPALSNKQVLRGDVNE